MTAPDAAELAEGLRRDLGIRLERPILGELQSGYRPRYNAAPATTHWLLGPGPTLHWCSWGLPRRDGGRLINARVESLDETPSFQRGLRDARRVLIVDGFFEWGGTPRGPWHFRPELGQLAALACVGGPEIEGRPTFAVVTGPAIGKVADVHDRMPVALEGPALRGWLESSIDDAMATLRAASTPVPGTRETAVSWSGRRVDTRVNSPMHDDPECLAEPSQGELFET